MVRDFDSQDLPTSRIIDALMREFDALRDAMDSAARYADLAPDPSASAPVGY